MGEVIQALDAGGLDADEIEIGNVVIITGVVVARTEFADGPNSYMVEFERRGRPVREWFLAGDLDNEGFDDGGGI